METRKESLSTTKLCRFCLSRGDTLTSIYERYRAPKHSVTLPLKILSSIAIEVYPSDKMPTYICNRCKFFMEITYDFKHMCRQADEHILQFVQNAIPLTSMTWPQSLLKLFRTNNKSQEMAVMKTVVEGGATVQVTAHESDSDDEDDENVYNVKIGDGSDEGSKSARVKVITGEDKQVKGKLKRGGKDPAELDSAKLVRQTPQKKSELRDDCWACDECECTYPLQQMLDLHKAQKHRERNVQCNQCEAKFFTSYDMITHQLRHTNEMSFQCVACDKKFKRLLLLKRHEKLMHADLPQQPCPYCPASFLSVEELEAHQKKHNRIAKLNVFICDICNKRFHEKSSLARHIGNIHNREPSYSCEYCPSRFASPTKLARHVRTHAGDRTYPCKYCNKSFVKSHHYTRHLRLKHRETIRTCRGPFGESDQYRCEQCEDSFATQDELIYHSAIHATQNLTCPLCQEKFEDVDAVTAHIKSHVTGTEFMCDLCELVFTSKEKLDCHIANAHDDEMRALPDLLQDESSMEMDAEDDEYDNGIHVKEEDDHMVVEIKKADEFMLSNSQVNTKEKIENTNSEESEPEMAYPELSAMDDSAILIRNDGLKSNLNQGSAVLLSGTTIVKTTAAVPKNTEKSDNQTASILRKAEEIKKKVVQTAQDPIAEKREKNDKNNKSENSNSVGASDKSLRLLEKELQELKRTNTRSETVKTPTSARAVETLRNRRAQIHTSTPKLRAAPAEEKKAQVVTKSPAVEKKLPERRAVTKENKEPKDNKEVKSNNVSAKEDKEQDVKEKDTPKAIVKNGNSNDKSNTEDGVRRSTRPSKIKDYAKMIRDRSQDSDDMDDSDDANDEEYKETEKVAEIKPRGRRASVKTPAPKPTPPNPPRKRGRPRKEPAVVPPKVPKEEIGNDNDEDGSEDGEKEIKVKKTYAADVSNDSKNNSETEGNASVTEKSSTSGVLVSPTGQTLKKIPIKALPPGVKPMPLPLNARPVPGGEVCEMQIGAKMVKVQKIVMTKAEVEAMTKKGLVEMKDGTMVLKQGIKIPTAETSYSTILKSSLVGEDAEKESPSKKEKATPSRCDFGEEA